MARYSAASARAIAASLVSPVALGLLALTDAGPILAITVPVAIFGFGNGFAIPMVNALAVGADPRMAGAGSSLLGFWGYAMGAGGTIAAGLVTHQTAMPLAIVLAVVTAGALVCFTLARLSAARVA